jgi:hypothetical protein
MMLIRFIAIGAYRLAAWLFMPLFVWLIGGEVPMLAITLTEAEAYGVVKKKCSALSRRLVQCPYEIGTQVVARVKGDADAAKPFAVLTVKTVRAITGQQVTDELAKGEGFSGLPAWESNQTKLYGGKTTPAMSLYRIGFDVEKMLTDNQKVEVKNARQNPY